MSRRPLTPPDSLEMLLDTMCNTFGGIILIALLIALLARDSKVQEAETRAVTEGEAMLQRRVAAAEEDLRAARTQAAALAREVEASAQAGVFAWVEERARLQGVSAGLSEALRVAQGRIEGGAVADAAQVEAALRRVLQEAEGVEQQQAEARGLTVSLQARVRELQGGVAADSNRLVQAAERRVQRLRLPREHETTKAHLYIVVWQGRLFPLYVFREGVPERNVASLRWVEESPGVRRVEPVAERGVAVANDAAVRAFFGQFPAEGAYLVFQVYEDSFGAFNVAKGVAVGLGFEFTWQPRRSGEVLRVGAGGTPPPPQ